MRERYELGVVTNDLYTREDADFLIRHGALTADRIRGVETGGCPHTAIREDASINLAAVEELTELFPLDAVLVESGGDNLSATFSPELSDWTLYVIDVSAGDKIPRKGGPGITQSDLIINKTDLAPIVGASLDVMDRDAQEDAWRETVCIFQPRRAKVCKRSSASSKTAACCVREPHYGSELKHLCDAGARLATHQWNSTTADFRAKPEQRPAELTE